MARAPGTADAGVRDGAASGSDPEVVEAVGAALRALARAVRAHQLYLPNNPMHTRALQGAREAFGAVWEALPSASALHLAVTEDAFVHDGEAVFTDVARGGEALPWMFHAGGVRGLSFQPGFEHDELEQLAEAVQRARASGDASDDLATLLWESDFSYIAYEHVVATGDERPAPGEGLLRPFQGVGDGGSVVAPLAAPGSDVAPATLAADDGARALLEPHELEYLQALVRDEFAAPPRAAVVAALLDTLESEADAPVLGELIEALETLLPQLLAAGDVAAAAYLLREAAAAAQRASALPPAHGERLHTMGRVLRQPGAAAALLERLEGAAIPVAADDARVLLAHLDRGALSPVLERAARTANSALAALLGPVVERLCAAAPGDLVPMLAHDDAAVVAEAARRAGALRVAETVPALAMLLQHPEPGRRAVALEALARIGSAAALEAVQHALEDSDREIRLAAVQALVDAGCRAAAPRLARMARVRHGGAGAGGGELTAVLSAYAALAGEQAVPVLEALAAPRGLLARREDPVVRAAAATALGRLGTPAALAVLRRAGTDREPIVRSAATRALQQSGAR